MIYSAIDYWNSSPDSYLEHHGVKGMKWGIRKKNRNPENKIIKESIKAGSVSTKLNVADQKKHIRGRDSIYDSRGIINKGLTEVEKMMRDMSLTGTPIVDANGN